MQNLYVNIYVVHTTFIIINNSALYAAGTTLPSRLRWRRDRWSCAFSAEFINIYTKSLCRISMQISMQNLYVNMPYV